MTHRKVIKMKNAESAYQNWREAKFIDRAPEYQTQGHQDAEVLKAEPDLMAAPEPILPAELEAAIEVIQEGGLTQLTATQQKIFQLSIVEGEASADIAEHLELSEEAVEYELERIGTVLRKLCMRKLKHS